MIIVYMIMSLFIYMLVIPIFLFSTLSMLVICIFNIDLFYMSIKYFCRLILFSMGLFPKIIGSFPKEGQFIVMMNHSSFLDMFLYPLFMQNKWSGIIAIENFKYPFLSPILKRLHAIPIDRKNKYDAINSIKLAEKILGEGYHIGIMPEGSRTKDGKMQPFKKGGFHMAMNTSTSILPVGVSGVFSIKPKNRWWIKPGKIIINIGSPINVTNNKDENLHSLLKKVESKIKSLSGEFHEH